MFRNLKENDEEEEENENKEIITRMFLSKSWYNCYIYTAIYTAIAYIYKYKISRV